MKDSRARRAGPAGRDRGFALIAFVLLVVMVSAYVIAAQLNRTNSELARFREDRTMDALRQAKTALIAHAASEEWQLYKALPSVPPVAYVQPGALPCPDQDNDGDADCLLPLTSSMIGRLPWKTLGIADLRDASGEQLWYALSHDFRKNQCPGAGCTTINSDTLGQLTLNGSAPATQVVAIVFAPGQAIQGQARDGANALNPSNYLELFSLTNPVNYVFTTSVLPSDTFNDRLIAITQAELMAAVEPIVAARIERDIRTSLQSYSSGWGNAFPFPALFVAGGFGPVRAQDQYKGAAGETNGLLPLTAEPGWVSWENSVSVTGISGGTGNTSFSSSCSLQNSGTLVSCQIDYSNGSSDRPAIRLQATLLNAALSFVNPVAQSDKTMIDHDGAVIDWSNSTPLFAPTVDNILLADGKGRVVFQGRLRNGASTEGRVTIQIPLPAYHALTNAADPTTGWFVTNQWYRQTYFAVSPGFLPGGGSTCNPLPAVPSCLTVGKLSPAFVQTNDKRAILILAGRSLSNAPRPSNSLPDYLEGANLSAAQGAVPYSYEHRAGVPTAINDRVVVVAP